MTVCRYLPYQFKAGNDTVTLLSVLNIDSAESEFDRFQTVEVLRLSGFPNKQAAMDIN